MVFKKHIFFHRKAFLNENPQQVKLTVLGGFYHLQNRHIPLMTRLIIKISVILKDVSNSKTAVKNISVKTINTAKFVILKVHEY